MKEELTQDDDEALIVQQEPQPEAHDDDPTQLENKNTHTQVSHKQCFRHAANEHISTVTDEVQFSFLYWGARFVLVDQSYLAAKLKVDLLTK